MRSIETKLVRVANTYVDPRFQREETRLKAKIKANFRIDLLQTPVLSEHTDGKYSILDGQHRILGGIESGKIPDQIWCTVHKGLTLSEEAALFVSFQDERVSVHARERYKAQVVAQDPDTVKIEQTLAGLGLRVSRQVGMTDVQAISSLLWLQKNSDLYNVLLVAKTWAFAAQDPTAYEGTLLRALGHFMGYHPEADLGTLSNKLSSIPPGQMINRIKSARTALGLSPAQASVERIREAYNFKLQAKQRLVPRG